MPGDLDHLTRKRRIRAVVTFPDMAAVKANEPALIELVVRWIEATA